jgi:phosphopantetheinyl transferase (holo-ACP synthase)
MRLIGVEQHCPPHAAALLGVGIDLAEQGAFSRLDDASIRRAAARWLRPDERAWCVAQPLFREAMVIVLSCKEAMYKAWDASGEAHELSLTMHRRGARAATDGIGPEVVASWGVTNGSILTFAVAARAGWAGHLLATLESAWLTGDCRPTRLGVNSDAWPPHLAGSGRPIASAKVVRQLAVLEPLEGHVSCMAIGQSATTTAPDDALPGSTRRERDVPAGIEVFGTGTNFLLDDRGVYRPVDHQ